MGEKDKTEKEKKQMTSMENWFLSLIVPRETNTTFFKFHVKHD
jgi:hypothetical protein